VNKLNRLVRRWYLVLPVGLVCAGILVPLTYLVLRAFQADLAMLSEVVLRWRNLVLLFNTVTLAVGVLVVTTLIALPLAWLTARVDFTGRTVFTLLGVLPLAVPGYVMAYVLLATTGGYGTLARLLDVYVPRLSGYSGALIALSLTTYPYLFLNLRTSLLGMDPQLEESARSLGSGPVEVFFTVILPQLRPGFLAGGLLVGLHVLGDFGVVSLMRFDTFSYALYLQYTASYDRIYAAWLALFMLLMTVGAFALEAYLLKGLIFHSDREEGTQQKKLYNPGAWTVPSYIFAGAVGFLSVGLPVLTVGYWMLGVSPSTFAWGNLVGALWNSVSASVPAALIAAALAVPLAYVGVRYDSFWARGFERVAYLGYATPPIAFALAVIVFTLTVFPLGYQTLWILVGAYALHFLAEAIGPIRSSLYQVPPNLEDAARSLGSGSLRVFARVLFPLLQRGVLVSMAFVFLSAVKELPLTLLLAPPGFQTLSMRAWSYSEELMFADAAPYALTIILFSACFVGLLLREE
jgi:iron(III) transport system permease protein